MNAPLVILSGPSGVGKSTLIRRVLALPDLNLRLSVSATTRNARPANEAKHKPAEQDGIDYHFWNREQFEQALRENRFLEHAEVYGNYYGTLKEEVLPYREKGNGVLLDVDTQGAAQVKQQCPDVVRVVLRASSPAAYEQRLRDRRTDDEATIQKRLAGAQRELDRAGDYEYTVINDDLEQAVARFSEILRSLFKR